MAQVPVGSLSFQSMEEGDDADLQRIEMATSCASIYPPPVIVRCCLKQERSPVLMRKRDNQTLDKKLEAGTSKREVSLQLWNSINSSRDGGSEATSRL